jgi:ATP/maltotriose-dependent transcriptional regulator MalT
MNASFEVVEIAGRGRAAAIVIEGEAGIGKTRLVEEISAHAEAGGFRIFVGRAEELERTRPFGVIVQALGCTRDSTDPRRAEIGRLISGDREGSSGTSDPGLQYRAIDTIVQLVEEEALARRVALVVEDLHWADPSSALTLATLARRLRYLPFVLVATMRPLPRGPDLEGLIDVLVQLGARRMHLEALEDEAVREIAADLVNARPGPGLEAQLRKTSGNPLFVIELLRALDQEQAISRGEGQADVDEAALPADLRLTIIRGIAFLSEETLEALRVASVLGASFSLGDVAVATDRAVPELARLLRDARRAGVVEDAEGERLRFRHDLIRDAIYEDLPAPVRSALHNEVAQRLAESNGPALQVAEQFARAGAAAGPEAVEWIVRAAQDAAAGSPAVAAELFGRALDLMPRSAEERDDIIVQKATSLFWSGRLADAESMLREFVERDHDPSLDGVARGFLVQAFMASGRPQDALAEADAASHSSALPEIDRARIGAWGAHARMLLGDLDRAFDEADASRKIAEASGDVLTTCVALCCLSMTREFQGRFAEALVLAKQATDLADRSSGREANRFQIRVFEGMALTDLDRIDEAIAAFQSGRRVSEEIGARWNLALYQNSIVAAHYLTGTWNDALVEYQAYLELAEESGTRHGMISNNAVRGLISLHRGDLREAEDAVGAAEQEFAETGPQFRSDWMMWARSLLLEAQGRIDEAYSMLGRAWDVCSAMPITPELPLLGPDLVRLSIAAGDKARAEEVTQTLEAIAGSEEAPWLSGAALRCRGQLTQDSDTLMAAVDAYRRSPRLLDRANTFEDAACAMLRQGRADDAGVLADESHVLYEQLEAHRDIARLEAALRAWGVRRGRKGARRRPATGWESLTETEHRVVDLAAEGLSNPQIGERLFISRRTVQTHLGNIFAKLGLSSRVELAAEVARRSATVGS